MIATATRAEKISFVVLFLVAATLYGMGLHWGLPSTERKNMVLEPERQTMALFERIVQERQAQASQAAPLALISNPNDPAFEQQLYQSLSSFLIRSMDGDEQRIYVGLARLKPWRGQWDPGYYTYGGPYYAAIGASLLVGKVLGSVDLTSELVLFYQTPERMASYYYFGRLVSALSGLACLVLLYLVGRRLLNWQAALMATALFAFAPITMYLTHTVKPHLLGAAFGLAAFYFCIDIFQSGRWRDYILAGVACGLATGTTMNLWPLTLLIVLTHFLRPDHRSFVQRLSAPQWWVAGVLAIAVFFVVNPFILINSAGWVADLKAQAAERKFAFTIPGLTGVFGNSIAEGAGVGLWLPALLGAGWSFLKKDRSALRSFFIFAVVLTLLSVLQFGYTSIDSPHPARYLLPLFALMALAAGALFEELFRGSKMAGFLVAGFLAVFSCEQALMAGWNYHDDNSQTAVSMTAGRWINENIPAGTTIGTSTNLMVDRQPPFQFLKYRIVIAEPGKPIDSATAPEYFIASANPTLGADEDRPYIYHANFEELYEPVSAFGRVRRGMYRENFSSANYPVWIFKRKPSL